MKKMTDIIKRTLAIFSNGEMSVCSGYATLYILMALIPLLILIISAVNLIPGFSVSDMTAFLFQFLPDIPQVRDMITGIITNLNSQSGGLVASVSALTTLWSASNGVSAIQLSLEKLHGTKPSGLKGKPTALLFTILYILLIPAILLFHVLGNSLVELLVTLTGLLPAAPSASAIRSFVRLSGLITLAAMILVILCTYALLPKEKRSLKSQIPGAVFTSAGWILFSLAFSYFIPRFWNSSLYGSLAAVFLSAMWLKIVVTIQFYGAALNKALEE